jgi:hypothetical protein
MKGERRRGELELLDDRQKLAAISLKNPGASSKELAIIFSETYGKDIPDRTVRYDLQILRKQWKESALRDIEQARAIELQRLDHFEQEVWFAWRRSLENRQKEIVERLSQQIAKATQAELASSLARELADKNEYVTEEVLETIIANAIEASLDNGEDDETFVHKITQVTEGSAGNPQYLAQIHRIQQDRRKILGVYAPELHAIHMEKKIEVKGYKGGWSPDDWDNVVEGEVKEIKQIPAGGDRWAN